MSSFNPSSRDNTNPTIASSQSHTYAESTFSVETAHSEKPLLAGRIVAEKSTRYKRTGKTIKKFLSELGEPPTAAYERRMRDEAIARGETPKDVERPEVGMNYGAGKGFGGRT